MATAEPTAEPDAADDAAPPAKRSKLKVFAVAGLGLSVCLAGAGYFAVPAAMAMFAPAKAAPHAADASVHQVAVSGPLALVRLALPDAAASDYQIVSIFDGEAFLATEDNLIRVKVGSTAPGLGDILSIVPSDTGGTVVGTLATLKTS